MKKYLFLSFALATFWGCASAPLLPEGKRPSVEENLKAPFDAASIYFNTRDLYSKAPYGAVEMGTPITLRVTSRASDLDSITLLMSMKIIEGHMDSVTLEDTQEIEMTRERIDEVTDAWSATFTADFPGIFSYYFSLKKGSYEAYLGNNQREIKIAHVTVEGTGGLGYLASPNYVVPFDVTVYSPDIAMDPKWQNMVIYYIFPDRFKNGNKANDPKPGVQLAYGQEPVEFHENWNDPAPYVPGSSGDEYWNNDFYGGDLDGVIQKLDYMKTLGTTHIYMTPIFRASSNHKYDTADYMTIDPSFGKLETFQRLVSEAKKRGIGIIVDASLNHAGADSIYMDRFSKYNSQGAFEGEVIRKDSPYYEWFEWVPNAKQPGKMYRQWAVESLANLDESDSWKNFAYRNRDSVTKFWLGQGAAGWRMDVTPWVSDEFWMEWRKELKKDFPDSITFSEVWFDASKYLDGTMFDSNMNYFFRTAALELGKGNDTSRIQEIFEMVQEKYPREAFYRMMNLTSTHDVARTLWELGYKRYGAGNYSSMRAKFLLTSVLQFTMPGAPTIFYGDEVGLTGGSDPNNRGPYPWKEDGGDYGDFSLIEHYQEMAALRQKWSDRLVWGNLEFFPSSGNFLGYQRISSEGKRALILFNNGGTALVQSLPMVKEGNFVHWKTGEERTFDSASILNLEPLSFGIWLEK